MRSLKQIATDLTMLSELHLVPLAELLAVLKTRERAMIVRKKIGSRFWVYIQLSIGVFETCFCGIVIMAL